MAAQIDITRLIAGCGDDSSDGGIQIRTQLEPLAGPMAPVKPATYAPARQGEPPRFQEDVRWWGDDPAEPTSMIVIDSVPSQANRLEAALADSAAELGLPTLLIDFAGVENLPSHLPRTISSFQFPHRHADAYLRDAEANGQSFAKTPEGSALLQATVTNPGELFRWFPQSLLFGYWQSHLGSKRTQAKLARSWTSEIVGVAPATHSSDRTRVIGVKGDALNLSTAEGIEYDEADVLKGWKPVASNKTKLSAIGYGQVPYGDAALGGVSFRSVEQVTTVSFASLRRINCEPAGRALLVALGLAGHVRAFGRPFTLRSGCELRPVSATWKWIGAQGDEEIARVDAVGVDGLFRDAINAAGELATGGGWNRPPMRLTPNPQLADVIRKTWPLAD